MQGASSRYTANYVAARVGFEPATLRMQGAELTMEPPRPLIHAFINHATSVIFACTEQIKSLDTNV